MPTTRPGRWACLWGWVCLVAAARLVAQETAEVKRLYLYDDAAHYPWSGYSGTSNGASVSVDLYSTNAVADGYCAVRMTTAGYETWCALSIQSRTNLWADPGIDLSGCTAMVYAIRGGTGGEHVILKLLDECYTNDLVLSAAWTVHTNVFTGPVDLTSIYHPFTIVVDGSQAVTVYLDEIVLLYGRQSSGRPPRFPRLVRGLGYNEFLPARYRSDLPRIHTNLHANALRFWAQNDVTPALLEAARSNDLGVLFAYWLPRQPGDGGAEYTNPVVRLALQRSVLNFIDAYWPHPSFLAIVLGNEVFDNLDPGTETNLVAFATLLDEVCVQVQTRFPGLRTAYAGVNTNPVARLKAHTPHLDIYGCNSYGGLASVVAAYPGLGYDKPLLFLEYGCYGWWPGETNWAAYPDAQRAADYTNHWRILRKGRTLGGCAFTWRDKTEGGYTGWGLVDDGTLAARPAYDAVALAYGAELAPESVPVPAAGNAVQLDLSGLHPGRTARIERCDALAAVPAWTQVDSAVATRETNRWGETPPAGWTQLFYRLVSGSD